MLGGARIRKQLSPPLPCNVCMVDARSMSRSSLHSSLRLSLRSGSGKRFDTCRSLSVSRFVGSRTDATESTTPEPTAIIALVQKVCPTCNHKWCDKYNKDECPKCLEPLSSPTISKRLLGEASTPAGRQHPMSAMESYSGVCSRATDPDGGPHHWKFGKCVQCGKCEGEEAKERLISQGGTAWARSGTTWAQKANITVAATRRACPINPGHTQCLSLRPEPSPLTLARAQVPDPSPVPLPGVRARRVVSPGETCTASQSAPSALAICNYRRLSFSCSRRCIIICAMHHASHWAIAAGASARWKRSCPGEESARSRRTSSRRSQRWSHLQARGQSLGLELG